MRLVTMIAVGLPLLAGCGTATPDREVGAAAAGAGTGAVIGLLGGPFGVVAGALIGAGAGAATGAAIAPSHLDLGAPPWSSTSTASNAR